MHVLVCVSFILESGRVLLCPLYATAYLVLHGQRFTLAVTPVTRSESLKEVLQELLLLVGKAGLKIGLLLLDRGFYSVEIIRYLQQARRPFLMPVVCHGRKADHPLGPSGSNVFKPMKKSGWFRHTLKDGKKGQGHGLDLREAGAVDGPAWQAEGGHVGVRLLGDRPQAGGLGEGHVPQAVRDRDELSADEPVPDPDDDQEVQRAVPVRGDRVVAEEPVGVAALFRPVEPAAGRPAIQLGPPARGADADLAGAGRRDDVWTGRHNTNGKICARISSDLTYRGRSFGKY